MSDEFNKPMTKEELNLINKIKENRPLVHKLSDGYILRWLRANSGDLGEL